MITLAIYWLWLVAAVALYDAILVDKARITHLEAEVAELKERVATAEAEADHWYGLLDELAEQPEPSRARAIVRTELDMPYSDWPKRIAA